MEQYLDFVLENTDMLYLMEKGQIIYSSDTAAADGIEVQRLMTE